MRNTRPQHLAGVERNIQREYLRGPGLVLTSGKAVFIAAVNSPNLKLCLKGREKGESGQPVFPSFSRVLLQGLPTSDSLPHRDTLCLWPNHRPFTPHLDAASSWILEVMMRNRFQGNHGAKVLWVAPDRKGHFSPCLLI